MRHSKDDEYRELKREAKRQGIEVNTLKYNPGTATDAILDVPPEHKDKFSDIQELGRIGFFKYGHVPNNETSDKPWQKHSKLRALKLMLLAAKCRRENSNESGWRGRIEERLFERFDVEVACKRCRKRLWRSEIEVSPASSNSRTTSLKSRQSRRQACTCNPNGRMDDYSALDPGLSDLFSSRIEEPCVAPDSSKSYPKKRPDRIHGLQRTKNFDVLLQSPYAHDNPPHQNPRLVEDVVKTTLNPDNGGSPLLFPFLIAEAKREKGAENFEQMEVQTAFPIKHALQLQYDLLKTTGNTMDVPGGPLVWFLANRGEDWRVYAGHVKETEEGRIKYIINYLWGGSITGIDEILQLILIIDYIVDWARDVFRPNILRQLRTLSTANYNDTMTYAHDPDVYSLRGEVQPWMAEQDVDPGQLLGIQTTDVAVDATSDVTDEDAPDPLDRYTTTYGVVKDARQIHSRLRGLIITRDNFNTLLQSFDNPNDGSRFARSVVSLLSRRCIFLNNEDVLDAVENLWTGSARIRPHRLLPKPGVYVQIRISFYINPVWEQVRELTYLAVTEDARDLLIEHGRFRRSAKPIQFSPPQCSKEDLILALDELRRNSVRNDLISSLRRLTYMMSTEPSDYVPAGTENGVQVATGSKVTARLDKEKKGPGVLMQGTVHAVFEKHRIGNRQPSEPFLRASTSIDCLGRVFSKDVEEELLPSEKQPLDKILVFSAVPNARYLPDGARQRYCIYLLDGRIDHLDNLSITAKLICSLLYDEIYGTVRKAKVYKTSRNWQDNRADYFFSMDSKKIEDQLKMSKVRFREDIFGWIRAANESKLSDSME